MRGTRAYIASAGTAAVMLGVSVGMFVLVSAFVAFGSWPGAKAATQLDSVVLADLSQPKAKKVAVRSDAVALARRAEARQARAGERAIRRGATDTPSAGGTRGERTQGSADAPASGTPNAGSPVAAAPNTGNVGTTVQQQTQNVTQNVRKTTENVATQVGQTVQQGQQQVNEVVDQVVGGTQQAVDNTTQTVQKVTGGLLGK